MGDTGGGEVKGLRSGSPFTLTNAQPTRERGGRQGDGSDEGKRGIGRAGNEEGREPGKKEAKCYWPRLP